MYLSSYTFTGDTTDLIARYDRLFARYRDELLLHVVVVEDDALVVYDACPDRETAEAFWSSPEWAAGLAEVGLAMPAITGLGEIHAAVANASVPV